LILLVITVAPVIAYGEVWKVQIPAGSSDPSSLAHFMPSEISVRPGDKVEWGNADTVTHTVTSGTLESGLAGKFDSGQMAPGSRFAFMFDKNDLGEVKYFCTIHPWMIGIVNVVDLPAGFQVYHNVGAGVSDSPVDIEYKVQRNLVSVDVDPARNMIVFNFAGRIDNDKFLVRLPEEVIKNTQSVWINDSQTTNYELTKKDGVSTLTVVLSESVEQVKVVGTDVIGNVVPKKLVLINQMYGITDKKSYGPGDEVVVSGEIKNPVQLYQITLDVVSPNGVTVYHKDVPLLDSTKFTESFPTSGILRDFGKYTVKITGPSAKSLFLSFEYGLGTKEFRSPLKQMNSGITPGDVVCNEGLQLFMKVSDGNAVCLTESSSVILMKRGWADYF
jgi:plastocyanin